MLGQPLRRLRPTYSESRPRQPLSSSVHPPLLGYHECLNYGDVLGAKYSRLCLAKQAPRLDPTTLPLSQQRRHGAQGAARNLARVLAPVLALSVDMRRRPLSPADKWGACGEPPTSSMGRNQLDGVAEIGALWHSLAAIGSKKNGAGDGSAFARLRRAMADEIRTLSAPGGPRPSGLDNNESGAGDGIRTHDVQLGKLAFYR